LLARSFCFFHFAKEITLFAFCLLSLYSIHASVNFSFFPNSILSLLFPYCSATSSFHHHVSLCLHGPFDNPHVTCVVSILIFSSVANGTVQTIHKSFALCSRQTTMPAPYHLSFISPMPLLMLNQQCQSIEGSITHRRDTEFLIKMFYT